MDDSLIDYSFINCDLPYEAFVRAAYEADTEEERKLLVSFLIQYLDFVVFSGAESSDTTKGRRKVIDAINAVRYCLRDRVVQNDIWQWLWRKLPTLSLGEQSRFAVGVLCPILTVSEHEWDDPYEMTAKDRLLQCYHDPTRKWAVLEGFTECNFEQASTTLTRYNQWRQQRGLTPLVVDTVELEEYLRKFGGPTGEEDEEDGAGDNSAASSS